jgi:phosphate uptake regulator
MVALPKMWVGNMGLHAGDQVIIRQEDDGSLSISPTSTRAITSKAESTLQISGEDSVGSIVRKLISCYLLGYTTMHIRPSGGRLTTMQRNSIKMTVRRSFIGTELIADSTEGITIQVLLSLPELSVENAVRRMFLITAAMHRDAIRALRDLDVDAARGVVQSDDEVDRFSLYVIRHLKIAVQNAIVLKEIGLKSSTDCLGYRLIIKAVERVADHASRIAEEVSHLTVPLKSSVISRILTLSDQAVDVFEEAGLALFKSDYNAADAVVDKAKHITQGQDQLVKTLEKQRAVETLQAIRLTLDDIRRTAEYASDIAEVVLNMTADTVLAKNGG